MYFPGIKNCNDKDLNYTHRTSFERRFFGPAIVKKADFLLFESYEKKIEECEIDEK